MKKNKGVFFLFSTLIVAALACNLPASAPPTASPTIDVEREATLTSIVLTRDAGQNLPPVQPEFTPTITLSPTIPPTGTLSIPMVSVSVDTNCRTGPGVIYDYLTSLMVGEKAEVVGKYTSVTPTYWIIKKGSTTCWLWGQYATVEGNTSSLPEKIPPPSPTPTFTATATLTATSVPAGPNFNFSFEGISHCSAGDDYAIIKWVNSGSVAFESARTEIRDLDAAATLYGPAQSDAPFGAASPGCGVGNSSLGAGSTAYSSYYIGTPAPAGHHIRITVTICTQNNMLGDCKTNTLDSVLP